MPYASVAACLAAVVLIVAPSASAEGHYAFVSENGEVHLTNVPDDARYRSLDSGRVEPRPAAPEARPYGAVVDEAAQRYGLEPALLHAVITVESGYNPRAVSRRGAAGLMQLMPVTARRLGVIDVFNPVENIHAGARYLMELMQRFGSDVRLALAAYNAGEAAVVKHGYRIPPYRETAAYVPKVVGLYTKYRSGM